MFGFGEAKLPFPLLCLSPILSIARKSRGETNEEQQVQVQVQDQTSTSSNFLTEHLDWVVFGAVWAFLILNAVVYLKRSQE